MAFLHFFIWCIAEVTSLKCSPSSPPAPLLMQGDLLMQARQARGYINATSECALRIQGFELSPGPVSSLVGQFRTASDVLLYSQVFNESGGEILSLRLVDTAYSFADLIRLEVVESFREDSRVLGSFDPSNTTQNATLYLENCLQVTPDFRLRWTLLPNSEIDIGLEALLSDAGYVGFGPALPGIKKSLMPAADVFMAGFVDQRPFLVDGYNGGYATCTYGSSTAELDGVCDDYSWAGRNASADNLKLLYAHQFEGVSFFRFRRALKTDDVKFDHEITPFEPQSYIYAFGGTGSVWAPGTPGQRPWAGPQIQQHGLGSSAFYGQIDNLVLASNGSRVQSCVPFENLNTGNKRSASVVVAEPQRVWPNSAALTADGSINLRWEVARPLTTFSIQTSKPATKWLAVGFGPGMTGGYAYVGWTNEQGEAQVRPYTMSGEAAASVQPTNETITNISVSTIGGLFTVEFTRALLPEDSSFPQLDPERSVPVLWAAGRQWSDTDTLDDIQNTHFDRSGKPIQVPLLKAQGTVVTLPPEEGGGVSEDSQIDQRLLQHGWLMWAAFLVLGPMTMLAMRFVTTRWRAIFQYALFVGLILVAVGLGLGLATTGAASPFGPSASLHAKVGVAVLILFLWEFFLGMCYGARADPNGGKEGVFWLLLCYLPGVAMLLLAIWDVLLGLAEIHNAGLSDRPFKILVLATWYFWIPFILLELILEFMRHRKSHRKPSWLFWLLCLSCVALIIGISFPIHRLSESPPHQISYASQARAAVVDDKNFGVSAYSSGPVNFVAQAYTINFSYTEPPPTISPTRSPTSSPSAFGFAMFINVRRQANASFNPRPLARGLAQSLETRNLPVPTMVMSWPNASNTDQNNNNNTLSVAVRFQNLQSRAQYAMLQYLAKGELVPALVTLGLPVEGLSSSTQAASNLSFASAEFTSSSFVFLSPPTVAPSATITRSNGPPTSPTNALAPCLANVVHLVGDGWCDTQPSINGPECRYDGGDCCNVSSTRFHCLDPASPNYLKSSPNGTYPAPLNPRYTVQLPRVESTSSLVQTYNNYYEFGFSKDIYPEALKYSDFFNASGWTIEIGGLVENPTNISAADLINIYPLETRLYRHRCVEAWSIVVPWVGFPLAALLERVKPLPEARYIQFETWLNTSVSIGQLENPAGYSYPYVEGLTIEEGMNELSFLSVGQYQQPLPAQSGAPIRLTIPWKYGFKSIKALKSIKLVAERPYTFWESASQGTEYGFWANVNPKFPHRRWSQAKERFLQNSASSARMMQTLIYNGYEAQVKSMYTKIEEAGVEDLWH